MLACSHRRLTSPPATPGQSPFDLRCIDQTRCLFCAVDLVRSVVRRSLLSASLVSRVGLLSRRAKLHACRASWAVRYETASVLLTKFCAADVVIRRDRLFA